MAVYTVHTRTAAMGEAPIVFVPDAFSRAAFFLGPAWLAWRRAWLGFGLWVVVFAAGAAAVVHWRAPAQVGDLLFLILAILTGLEANNLRRAALERRGYACVDVASGDTIEAAERAYFSRASAAAPARAASVTPYSSAAIVGGLFPDAGG